MVEQSTDTSQRIVTLETQDGFRVRFSIPKTEQSQLGEALMQQAAEVRVLPN